MAIDIRATVTCSFGTLISASISDDYVQGTGLIKTKGSCELSGIVTPAIGTAVTFSYTKGGVTRQVPRKLRVLSSFADPFRRTTKVELGCKLTYLSDLQEPIKWTGADDPENSGLTEADAEIITRPIYASSVAGKCLTELGITASGSLGLTNSFSVAEFDFGAGYVSVLSDLLVSECRCGYLNTSEELVTFSLSQEGGTGPVLDDSKIIDLGPIGVGQLPGEAVVVSYSSLKLRNATESEPASSTVTDPESTEGYGGWDSSKTSSVSTIPVQYTGGVRSYRVLKTSETVAYYGPRQVNGQTENLVTKRVTTNTTSSVEIAGGAVAEYLSNGLGFSDVRVTEEVTERFTYDSQGNEQFREQETVQSRAYIACGANVPFVFSPTDYVSLDFSTRQLVSRVKTYTTTAKNRQLVRTETYLPWSKTINGQQTIAQGRESFEDASAVQTYLSRLYSQGLALASVETTIQTTSRPQAAPTEEDKINATNADKPDADVAAEGQQADDYRTESVAELELALGSSTAQRRIELSMPYAPDDRFRRTGISPNYKYWASKSNASIKAANYGRAQNALLLGNRSGMNVQTTPELVPDAPFAAVVVQANGLSALYRMNGTSWQMDASGVLLSSDLLFAGAIGGTGTFWFPVAPGVTTLPSTPPVVSGEMTVSSVVPVWNETVLSTARTRSQLVVTSLPYALALQTELAITSQTQVVVSTIVKVEPPLAVVSVTGNAPAVALGVVVNAPVGSMALTGLAPAVLQSTVVTAPAGVVVVAGLVPEQVGPDSAIVTVPLAAISLTSLTPEQVGPDTDTFFSSYYRQVYGWEQWIFPDWWAD